MSHEKNSVDEMQNILGLDDHNTSVFDKVFNLLLFIAYQWRGNFSNYFWLVLCSFDAVTDLFRFWKDICLWWVNTKSQRYCLRSMMLYEILPFIINNSNQFVQVALLKGRMVSVYGLICPFFSSLHMLLLDIFKR